MKKLLTAMTAIGVLTGAAIAQDVVTSVNIVGYKKHTLISGKFYLISAQFQSIDETAVTVDTAIGSQLPAGTEVHAWDAKLNGVGGYLTTRRLAATGAPFNQPERWSPLGVVLDGAQGFWIKAGGVAGTTNEVAFLGEVPLQASYTNTLASSYNMTAYPYTADVAFTNTALAASVQVGDEMHIFDPDTGYQTFRRLAATGAPFNQPERWSPSVAGLIITQGTGMWYRQTTGSDRTVVELRPYNP